MLLVFMLELFYEVKLSKNIVEFARCESFDAKIRLLNLFFKFSTGQKMCQVEGSLLLLETLQSLNNH